MEFAHAFNGQSHSRGLRTSLPGGATRALRVPALAKVTTTATTGPTRSDCCRYMARGS